MKKLSPDMWKQTSQLALLWFLFWEYHVSGLPDHEIVFPQKVVNREKRNLDPHNTDQWEEKVSYSIQTSNGTLLLKLQRNRGFVSPDFERFEYHTHGGLRPLNHTRQTHSCYYRGTVDGVPNSLVVLSTCHGLNGLVHIEDKYFVIEPVKNTSQGEHLLFELEKPDGTSMCGVEDFEKMTPHTLLPSFYKLRRMKRDVLPTTSYVELGMVVDNYRYGIDNSNTTAVEVEAIQLTNIVDSMFQPLNIRIVLTSLTIWASGNPINVNAESAGNVLGGFSTWRGSTSGLKRTDISHLLIGRGAINGVLGMAFVGTVCSPSYGTSISMFSSSTSLAGHTTVLAHELGHVLGMSHDDTCSGGNYIMHSSDAGAKKFSTCSSSDFESLILRGGGTCLQNPPDPNQVLSIPECGNKIVDQGEDCDCGTVQECNNPCCDAATCKLTKGSACAQGLCCENCQFKVAGTPCRPQNGYCDFPEYCNGTNGLCPADFYKMNGYPCNNSTSYCFNGICQTYEGQCQNLYGTTTTKAIDGCFTKGNLNGDAFGNCGTTSSGYIKCSTADSLCGKLFCTGDNPNAILNGAVTFFYVNNTNKCFSANFNLGPDVPDPGMVRQGTGCGNGKACVNYSCQNASALGYNCDTKVKCNDHGVCDNNGNCFCDNGWAPPNCNTRGYGGSIDSGPTHIDTSLRDGLLIFFLLVLPILIALTLAWFKRDAIRRRCCRKKRRTPRSQAPPKPTSNTTTNNKPSNNNSRGQLDNRYSDIFTISHNPPHRPPLPSTNPQPPLRPPPPPPRPSAVPQYNWNQNV
ncbi:disintegrin and metallo ase domain-containing 9-like [Pelobates cultripes]|uniref:Disintegrin and metallo ase domain-containing 9-like n=1 Tax=Pelobates cultripes TaxID=61616 RepID=A0AAD1TC49_PELCU|nr:disintegrin and metallo ase domain-containing 9-like [Pelobates cultripes]